MPGAVLNVLHLATHLTLTATNEVGTMTKVTAILQMRKPSLDRLQDLLVGGGGPRLEAVSSESSGTGVMTSVQGFPVRPAGGLLLLCLDVAHSPPISFRPRHGQTCASSGSPPTALPRPRTCVPHVHMPSELPVFFLNGICHSGNQCW